MFRVALKILVLCVMTLLGVTIGATFAFRLAWNDAETREPGGSAVLSQAAGDSTACLSTAWTRQFSRSFRSIWLFVFLGGGAGLATAWALFNFIDAENKKPGNPSPK